MSMSTVSFGEFIAEMRVRRNLTQAEVARAIGVASPDFISLVEHGHRNLGLDRVPRLAAILRVNVQDLCLMALTQQYPLLAAVLVQTMSRRALQIEPRTSASQAA
jgi:transcriptional regulator with XRE-family HTH domain